MANDTFLISCTCGKKYQVPQSMAGKTVRCKACNNVIKVPPNPAESPVEVLDDPVDPPGELDSLPTAVAAQPNRSASRPTVTEAQAVKQRIMLIVCSGVGFLMFFTPQFLISVKADKDTSTLVAFGWSTWWGLLGFIVLACALAIAVVDMIIGGKVKITRSIFKWFYLPLHGIVAIATLVGTILGIFAIGFGGMEITEKGFGGGTVGDFAKALAERRKFIGENPSAGPLDAHLFGIPVTAILVLAACVVGAIIGMKIMREKN